MVLTYGNLWEGRSCYVAEGVARVSYPIMSGSASVRGFNIDRAISTYSSSVRGVKLMQEVEDESSRR